MFAEKLLRKIAGRREDAIGLDIGSGSVKMADVVLRNGKPYLKRMALMEAPERAVEDGTIVRRICSRTLCRNWRRKTALPAVG